MSLSPSFLPPTWQGFLLSWGRSSSRLPFRVYGKISSTQSEEAVVSVLLSSSPFNAALQNGLLCFGGFTCYNFLPEIFSFLKKIFSHVLQHYSCLVLIQITP